MKRVAQRVRRTVFGRDPGAYHRFRLPYPDRVYELLTTRCGLGAGAAVFEIGPGTGIATRELLRRGASSVTLIEPDRRFARYLADSLGPLRRRVTTIARPFERAFLPTESFDLGVAATSFHWLPERRALRKIARALRPGGWWACWSNQYGDPSRPSPFHRAIQPLYWELSGPRVGWSQMRASAARERARRLRALEQTERFDRIRGEEVRWSLKLTTARVKGLWATFSEIATLPSVERERFLTGLGRIVNEQFGGEATLRVRTPIYTARRS